MAFVPKVMLEAYLRDIADTDRALSRQLAELLELIRQYGPEPVADAIEKASAARAFGADYIANILRQQQSPRQAATAASPARPAAERTGHRSVVAAGIRRFHPRSGKEPDDPLEQKLNQLNLSTMSRQLETTLTEAAAKNLSAAATLEGSPTWNWKPANSAPSNAASNARACRRSPASTPFTSTITRAASRLKTAHPASARSRRSSQRHQSRAHRQSRRGQNLPGQDHRWRACQANQRVLFTTAMDMLNHLLASQVDHSLVRKLKTYTEPALLS
jgi:hypothetical protein